MHETYFNIKIYISTNSDGHGHLRLYSKAFDTVPHRQLLYKLRNYAKQCSKYLIFRMIVCYTDQLRAKTIRSDSNSTLTQPAQNVVLRLILGRDVEQPIFNVETTELISILGKQPIFNVRFPCWNSVKLQRWDNVRFQCWNNVIFWRCNNVSFQRFQRWNNVRFQRWFIVTKSNFFSTLKFDVVSTCIFCWEITEIH